MQLLTAVQLINELFFATHDDEFKLTSNTNKKFNYLESNFSLYIHNIS